MDERNRGWSPDDGRNPGLRDHDRTIERENRQSNPAEFRQSDQGGDAGPYQGGFQGGRGRPQGGFGGGGQGGDYVRGRNAYAPGAEIWREGSDYNPSGYHRQSEGGFGPSGQTGGYQGQGQVWDRPEQGVGFGASSGHDPNYGAGGFGRQQSSGMGGRDQAGNGGGQDYGQQGQSGWGGARYEQQSGGTYGQRDYGQSAQRSDYRTNQNYPGGYQGAQGHDPDYLSWRDNQLSSYDREYSAWREEQRRKHDEDYGKWRQERREGFGRQFSQWREDFSKAIGMGGDKADTNRGGGPPASPLGADPAVDDVADGGAGSDDKKS